MKSNRETNSTNTKFVKTFTIVKKASFSTVKKQQLNPKHQKPKKYGDKKRAQQKL